MSVIMSNITKGLQTRSSMHWARKFWHFGMGSLGLILFLNFGINEKIFSVALISLGFAALVVEYIRLNNSRINAFFCKIMFLLMRKEEVSNPTGFAFYVFGLGISLYSFSLPIALISSCFLIYSDPFASFVGVRYGKTKIISGRSLEGSVAFFLLCIIICVILKHFQFFPIIKHEIVFIFLASIGASLFEVASSSKYLDDNIVIPIASGIWMTVLVRFLSF